MSQNTQVAYCQEIEGDRFVCKKYCKHAQFQNAEGKITGYALDGSKMKYAVIDLGVISWPIGWPIFNFLD